MIQQKLTPAFTNDFGVKLKRFDLSAIEPDKESEGYEELRRLTAGQQAKTIEAQTDINIKTCRTLNASMQRTWKKPCAFNVRKVSVLNVCRLKPTSLVLISLTSRQKFSKQEHRVWDRWEAWIWAETAV